MKTINKKLTVLFAVLIFLSACTPSARMYSGPELPREQVAILEFYDPIMLRSIDDERVPISYGVLELLPGNHTISVGYFDPYRLMSYDKARETYTYSENDIVINIDLKPGRRYRVTYSREGNEWKAWVEETDRIGR